MALTCCRNPWVWVGSSSSGAVYAVTRVARNAAPPPPPPPSPPLGAGAATVRVAMRSGSCDALEEQFVLLWEALPQALHTWRARHRPPNRHRPWFQKAHAFSAAAPPAAAEGAAAAAAALLWSFFRARPKALGSGGGR